MTERIVADVLIPGRGEPIENGTVCLDGPQISYAGPTADAPPSRPDDHVAEVAVALPGVWDCHVHFTGMSAPNVEQLATTEPAVSAARATADAAAMVRGGVTSARDVGGLAVVSWLADLERV